MKKVHHIRTFLLGDFDLHPLSRMNFLPQALKVFFIRQPVAMLIAYVSVRIFESCKTPELLQWLFVIIGFTAAACFLIPYFTLMYKRLQGSILPFSRFILCVIIAIYLFFPSSDNFSWSMVAISCILSGLIYVILFILPNNNNHCHKN